MTTAARMLGTGLLVALVLPVAGFSWGFSVDDSWIVARVAQRGLLHGSFAFNPDGLRTDAITPLGLAEVIAGTCRILHTTDTFLVARWLGAMSALGSVVLAAWVAQGSGGPSETRTHRWLPWALTLGLSPSLAAWAGAGLETPVVALLCTLGCLVLEHASQSAGPSTASIVGPLLLGCAIGWRPELAAFAFLATTALERARRSSGQAFRVWPLLLLAFPPAMVASVRVASFGTPVPLALVAKEPDLASGLRYVLGSLLLCGPLFLAWLLAMTNVLAWRSVPRLRLWLPAFMGHAISVLLAGGDWMPLYRLWVPVLPWLVAITVRDWRPSRPAIALALAASLPSISLLWVQGPAARRVIERRETMVAALRPLLSKSSVTAAVDIGWVGRASSGQVVDLGGVTDPRVAELPGGHTSKLIAPGFFAARSVDTWLIRARDQEYAPGAPL